MSSSLWQPVRVLSCCLLAALFAVPTNLVAASHVVSSADLQKELVQATQARERNLETVRQFLSSAKAKQAMQSAHMDPEKVKTAVSSLSNAELAQLAARADQAQKDFAAGNLTDRDLLLIILGIAALALIIVAVR